MFLAMFIIFDWNMKSSSATPVGGNRRTHDSSWTAFQLRLRVSALFVPSSAPSFVTVAETPAGVARYVKVRCVCVKSRRMCSLALFPCPLPDGLVTLYESSNELVSGSSLDSCPKQEWDAPSLLFPRDALKSHSHLESSSKAAFLEHRDTLWRRSAGAWRDAGLSGLLEEIANASAGEVPRWVTVGAGFTLALLRRISSFHGSLFPHLRLSTEDMVAEFSQVLGWTDGAVRGLAWHPHTDRFAVALLDDSIRIYNSKSGSAPLSPSLPLSSRSVAPHSAVEASLCLSAGRGLSQLPAGLARRPHLPVHQTLLSVWGGGVTFLSWSPDGSRVLAATPSSLFRVWETRMWTCERWPCLKGRCQTGCWSPDGSRLLFSVQGERVIYALSFTDAPGEPQGRSGGAKAAAIVADLSETSFHTPQGEVRIGGDPETPGRPAVIAVFRTRSNPVFELLPCGFIQGEGEVGAEPRMMQFHPSFPHGAQLTVCWSNGRISHVPFYFMSAGGPRLGVGGSPPLPLPRTTDDGDRTLYSELCS
ncbi:hypothetical protein AAFF_G00298330 [Aldrovandia affinis]|uniref:Aladin seven-bladed propeller domain-containing protein n=1 Tax=Aldrovandia affinis TaxID=143900 RepID=A0AAD7W1C0_9TELE|nr:hypothetical protein AAFF_G00298330 [Aldrovandia affinis]